MDKRHWRAAKKPQGKVTLVINRFVKIEMNNNDTNDAPLMIKEDTGAALITLIARQALKIQKGTN